MEILVCMKQVPDETKEIGFDPNTGKLDLSLAEPKENLFDAYALELALHLTEACGGTVTVLTVGEEQDMLCLRNGISLGAKNAILVRKDSAEADDAETVAERIANALSDRDADIWNAVETPFDLIICGKESTDHAGAQVGALLAQKLDCSYVSDVVRAWPGENEIGVKKETDDGYCLLDVKFPAVLSAAKVEYELRYPNVMKRLASRNAKILEIAASPAKQKVEYLACEAPPKRNAGIKIQEEEAGLAVEKAMSLLAKDKVL